MSDQFTPGPWLREGLLVYTLRPCLWAGLPSFENAWQARIEQDGKCITPLLEIEANARLIAAAPDLLAALGPLIVIALDNLDGMNAETREECERDIATARAAIAKAREQS